MGMLRTIFTTPSQTPSPPHSPLGIPTAGVLPSGIPKIIHQTWSHTAVPAKFEANIRSWVKWHPDWRYKFWSDADNRMLVQRKFPAFLQTFDRLGDGYSPRYVKRKRIRQADAIRYMLLYEYGGFYMDLDFEALAPLDPLGEHHDIVIGQEPLVHAHLLNGMKQTICNAILGSRPRHPFWLAVLNHIKKRSGDTADPVDATGPRMLERVLAAWARSEYATKHPVWIAPDKLFYPQWDPAQESNLKSTCARLEEERQAQGEGGEWGKQWQLDTCRQNQLQGWANVVHREALATHHWAHTWLNDLSGKRTVELNTLVPRGMREDAPQSSADFIKSLDARQSQLQAAQGPTSPASGLLHRLDERQGKLQGNQQPSQAPPPPAAPAALATSSPRSSTAAPEPSSEEAPEGAPAEPAEGPDSPEEEERLVGELEEAASAEPGDEASERALQDAAEQELAVLRAAQKDEEEDAAREAQELMPSAAELFVRQATEKLNQDPPVDPEATPEATPAATQLGAPEEASEAPTVESSEAPTVESSEAPTVESSEAPTVESSQTSTA